MSKFLYKVMSNVYILDIVELRTSNVIIGGTCCKHTMHIITSQECRRKVEY